MTNFSLIFKASAVLSIISLCSFTVLTRESLASEYSEKFEKQLTLACEKSSASISKTCPCYASSVTKRYNDVQLSTIYSMLKNPEASKMFLVVHSPEAIACRGSVK